MPTDDLSAPLGQQKTPKRRIALPHLLPQAVAALLALSIVVFAAWAMLANDPYGGEPMATAHTNLTPANVAVKGDMAVSTEPGEAGRRYDGPAAGAAPGAPPGSKTVTIIDGSTGKREDVTIPGASSDAKAATSEQRLAEPSRHGPIPRIAEDGARPADAFAQPVKAIAGKPNAPRVAIVVGGLGTSANGTNDALGKLPGAVTLGFAPYAQDLESFVTRARADGHEILLQIPMEPFDYPDNDPGPRTLLTSLDAAQNVDRLYWLMSRFHGYVGIANFMGARFTASENALAPILRETAKRGLIYLDDSSSPRSMASQIAGANNLPFAKADIMLDAVPSAADVDRALGRLETMARERGMAVGMAGAMPVSIERIARWAKAAQGRGILLVPISAVVAKAKSS